MIKSTAARPERPERSRKCPEVWLVAANYVPHAGGAEWQAHRVGAHLATEMSVRTLTRAAPGLPRFEILDGVHVHRIGLRRGPRPIRVLVFGLDLLVRTLTWRGPSAICSYQVSSTALFASLASWSRRRPVFVKITGEHGVEATTGRKGRVLRRLGVAWIAPTRRVQSMLVAAGIPPERIHYIPNGVDTTYFSPASAERRADARLALGIEDDAPVVAFVGRLERIKGADRLVGVWKNLRALEGDLPQKAWLVVMGSGPLEAELRAALAGDPRVIVMPQSLDVRQVLAASDRVLLPSRSEGMPNVLLEALSCSVPVIASDIPSLRALVEDLRIEGVTLVEDWADPGLLVDSIRSGPPGAWLPAELDLMSTAQSWANLLRESAPRSRVTVLSPSAQRVGGTESSLAELINALQSRGCPITIADGIYDSGGSRLACAARLVFRLTRLGWGAGSADTLVAAGARASLAIRPALLARRVLRGSRPRFVVLQRGLDASRPKLSWTVDRMTSSVVDLFLANSDRAGDLVRSRVASQEVLCLPTFLGERWDCVRGGERRSGMIRIVMVGNDRPEKAYDDALSAVELLADLPDVCVTIWCSDGRRINQRISGSPLAERVRVIEGHRVSAPDLAAQDILFHAAVSESSPRAVLEALTQGCLVVATDVGDTRKYVAPSGWVVPVGDPAAAAAGLREAAKVVRERGHVLRTKRAAAVATVTPLRQPALVDCYWTALTGQ